MSAVLERPRAAPPRVVLSEVHSSGVLIDPHDVTAIIVTRGNVDLGPVLESLPPFGQILIWDNQLRPFDARVYGRYAAMQEATNPIVYVQDDDCLIGEIPALLEMYEPGRITANMPVSRWDDYPDSCLVGWGAIFDVHLPALAFSRWAAYHGVPGGELGASFYDERFLNDCDVIFTTLTPHVKVDLGFQHLPWAEGPDRMFKQPDHATRRQDTLEIARRIRDFDE